MSYTTTPSTSAAKTVSSSIGSSLSSGRQLLGLPAGRHQIGDLLGQDQDPSNPAIRTTEPNVSQVQEGRVALGSKRILTSRRPTI